MTTQNTRDFCDSSRGKLPVYAHLAAKSTPKMIARTRIWTTPTILKVMRDELVFCEGSVTIQSPSEYCARNQKAKKKPCAWSAGQIPDRRRAGTSVHRPFNNII